MACHLLGGQVGKGPGDRIKVRDTMGIRVEEALGHDFTFHRFAFQQIWTAVCEP